MKWQGRRTSTNVEDRRGSNPNVNIPRNALSGGLGGGCGTIIVIIVILFILRACGVIDLSQMMGSSQVDTPAVQTTYQTAQGEDELFQFVSVVFAETEDVWTELFAAQGMQYQYPGLVVYSGYVESACGMAGSATGPFYCPADYKVYIDLSFYEELQNKFQAPGDFAMAYVIAHEVGHHVQTILGIMEDVQQLQSQVSETQANELNVRLELQADYFAGVWAHYVERADLLEEGDIEEALNAASAVGDDRIQKQYQGYVVPDSFTHGTSEQRQRWFYKGFQSGNFAEGDTFNTNDL
ncbi:MAG: zinc metallopeptidase [Actinomycetota bacterium]|nr:zinc metallopeptidase [Actinomycetota bacterium]